MGECGGTVPRPPSDEPQRLRRLDEPFFRCQPVERIDPPEIARIELVVERVAQIVFDDRAGETRLYRLFANELFEVRSPRFVGAPEQRGGVRGRGALPGGPERE